MKSGTKKPTEVLEMMEKMNLSYGLVLVDEDCVIVRATDGIAICSNGCGDGYIIGHVTSAIPYRVKWDDEEIEMSDKAIVNAIHDDGTDTWCLAPRIFNTYTIGDAGPYDFVILDR